MFVRLKGSFFKLYIIFIIQVYFVSLNGATFGSGIHGDGQNSNALGKEDELLELFTMLLHPHQIS